jgi:hypothetical protein
MPLCDNSSLDLPRPSKSRLSETLLRLQQPLELARDAQSAAESQYAAWQERWSNHREQISRRLELIDLQLETLAQGRSPRPRLSVVGGEENAQ